MNCTSRRSTDLGGQRHDASNVVISCHHDSTSAGSVADGTVVWQSQSQSGAPVAASAAAADACGSTPKCARAGDIVVMKGGFP